MTGLFGRFIRWFVHFIGAFTLVRLLLLSLTLISVETGLIAVVGHIRPAWLPSTVLLALLVGWLLGRSKLPGWATGLAALAIGLVWLVLSVGQMSAPLDLLLAALPPFLRLIILRLPPDIGPFLDAWALAGQSLLGLADRLMLWLRTAAAGRLIIDPGIASLVWGWPCSRLPLF